VLKRCNQILNVWQAQRKEFVHHMVNFLTFQTFHQSIIVFIEQVFSQKHFSRSKNNGKKFPTNVQKTLPWISVMIFEGILYPHPLQEIKVYVIGILNQKLVILTFGQLIDHLIILDKLI